MPATTITVTTKASIGDRVLALNYNKRSAPTWEVGTVKRISINVNEDGSAYCVYAVRLDRQSRNGNGLWLHVGDDTIKPFI